MNNRQVAHLWANQAKPRARGSNFYFDGPALYSYGGHFCVGRIVENKRGRRAYLLNSDSYSISTSRHQHYARAAIADGEAVFDVPGASPRHDDNRERFRDRMQAAMARIPGRRTARMIEADLRDAQDAARSFNDYGAFFQLRGRIKVPQLSHDDNVRLNRYRLSAAERKERKRAEWEAGAPERARLQAEREAEAAKCDAERRQDFRNGLPMPAYAHIGGPCMLRLRGDTFETSHGANVPRADGIAALRLIARVLAGKQELSVRDCYTFGGFTLRSISADEVVIGCHHIPVSECAAMAALVGVDWPVQS